MTRQPSKFTQQSSPTGLVCPACRSNTKVVDSRPIACGYATYRRRVCFKCQMRFSTEERIVDGAMPDWSI